MIGCFVAIAGVGATDGVTLQRTRKPELAVFVFNNRARAKRTVPQFCFRDPGKGLPVKATGTQDRRAEPKIALAVFENCVNVVGTIFRIGEF